MAVHGAAPPCREVPFATGTTGVEEDLVRYYQDVHQLPLDSVDGFHSVIRCVPFSNNPIDVPKQIGVGQCL